MAIQTTNLQLVTVSSIGGDWAVASGMGGKHQTTAVRSKANGPKQVLTADHERNAVTTKCMFDAAVHDEVLKQLVAGHTYPATTITVTSIDSASNTIGSTPLKYDGCAVSEWDISDADANGEGQVELSITWATES